MNTPSSTESSDQPVITEAAFAEPVLVWRNGHVGRITVNRPRALNALTHQMVRRITEALVAWEHDDAVRAVLVTGAGERGLCAGADIRAIYEDIRSSLRHANDGSAGGASGARGEAAASGEAGLVGEASRAFFRDEYRLNARIAAYPKPYIAVMDGITMGGGVGISAHGSVRIVTDRSTVAMPETLIGLMPDVGATYLLSRAPGEIGTHLALTGASIGAGDAILSGLADHYVPAERIGELIDDLTADADADPVHVVRRHAEPTPHGDLAAHRPWIDACYAAGPHDDPTDDSVERIVARLEADGRPAAKETAELISGRSPTALKVTLRALRTARQLDSLEAALQQEYRVSCACLSHPDVVEGIRAQIIDKDRRPRWSPPRLDQVAQADVDRCFAPAAGGDLTFDLNSADGSERSR
jgi:enoyl-CoA hydratase